MLIFSEGFDYYHTTVDVTDQETNRLLGLSGWYQFDGRVSISDFAPYEFGKSLSFENVSSTFSSCAFALPSQVETGYLGLSLYIGDDVEEGDYAPEIRFIDTDGNQIQFSIVLQKFGCVEIYLDNTDTPFFHSLPNQWTVNTWFFIEIGTTIAVTTGQIEVRINTVPVCAFTNITNRITANDWFDAIGLGSRGPSGIRNGAHDIWWDNIYLCDDQGTYNNTFRGVTRCQGLLPAAPGDNTDWTPFDPMLANWENASNELIDDSLYVFTDTPGNYDLYEVDALVNSPVIFAVSVKGAYRQTDATQRSVQNVIKSGATTDEGTEHFTSSTYQMYKDIWETDPATGVAWLDTAVNGVQVGPKLES